MNGTEKVNLYYFSVEVGKVIITLQWQIQKGQKKNALCCVDAESRG